MKTYTVYLSYEDGKPTLWDSPAPGRQQAIWMDDEDGNVSVHTILEPTSAELNEELADLKYWS